MRHHVGRLRFVNGADFSIPVLIFGGVEVFLGSPEVFFAPLNGFVASPLIKLSVRRFNEQVRW